MPPQDPSTPSERLVRTPDNIIHRFPAAATDEMIQEALASYNRPPPKPQPFGPGGMGGKEALSAAGHFLTGVGQGTLQTIHGLDELLAAPFQAMGVKDPHFTSTMDRMQRAATPGSTAAAIGKEGEQIGEFFVPEALAARWAAPLRAAARLKKAGLSTQAAQILGQIPKGVLDAIGAYTLTRMQGGSTGTAEASGAIAGLVPLASPTMKAAAPALRRSAARGIRKVLETGLTEKQADSADAPKILARAVSAALTQGLSLTWPGWKKATLAARETAGKALETTLAGPEGSIRVSTQPVIDVLDDFVKKNAQHTVPPKLVPTGKIVGGKPQLKLRPKTTVAYNADIIESANELKGLLQQYGGDIEVRQLHDLKSLWDTAVFGGKEAGAPAIPLRDRLLKLDRATRKQATDQVRRIFLSRAPSVAAADRAAGNAIKLNQIVKRAAYAAYQEGSLARTALKRYAVPTAIGGILGAEEGYRKGGARGSVYGGILGTLAGREIERVIASPGWRLAPAAMKQKLADAFVSGNTQEILRITGTMTAGAVAQER